MVTLQQATATLAKLSICEYNPANRRRSMSSAGADTGKRREPRIALVVEDDADCREMVRDTLADAGYVVLEAGNGAQALQLLLADGTPEPMVIVLDVWMPVMSGPELMKALKGHDRLSQIPVILTSAGVANVSYVEPGTAWLPKPFQPEHLLALVNNRCGA